MLYLARKELRICLTLFPCTAPARASGMAVGPSAVEEHSFVCPCSLHALSADIWDKQTAPEPFDPPFSAPDLCPGLHFLLTSQPHLREQKEVNSRLDQLEGSSSANPQAAWCWVKEIPSISSLLLPWHRPQTTICLLVDLRYRAPSGCICLIV